MQLRYGMNPQQAASVCGLDAAGPMRLVHGDPSYINLLEAVNG